MTIQGKFYVSVVDGPDYRFLAGPYDTHAEALAMVESARRLAVQYDPKAHFYAYGTAKAPAGYDKPGIFALKLAGADGSTT